MVRSGLWFGPFNDLADPASVAGLAAEAEERGWDGVFVWDHLFWHDVARPVADPWITLAAVAVATETIRIGPMVTPIARRRAAKLARETASLDVLSGGRLTLGVGLGSDRFGGEFSRTGEELDDRARAVVLDETLTVLRQAWSGEPVDLRGQAVTVTDARFLPRPVQRPGVPVWVAGFPGNKRPVQRAARHDGFFPVNLAGPDQLAEVGARIAADRAPTDPPFDLVVELPPGADTGPWVEAGATWLLTDLEPDDLTLDTVRGVLRDGPFG